MRARIFFFLLLAATLFTTDNAHSCSCVGPILPQVEFEQADAVFAGFVVRIDDPSADCSTQTSADILTYHFTVTHIWKGEIRDTLSVNTERMGVSCGYVFKPDEHYLVYAGNKDGTLRTGACTRNNPMRYAVWDRHYLQEPLLETGEIDLAPVTIDDLCSFLGDPDPRLRLEAAQSLGSIEERKEETLGKLVSIIRDPQSTGAPMAARALGHMKTGAEPVLADLEWALAHGDAPLRAATVGALRKIASGNQFMTYVLKAWNDTDPQVRAAASQELIYVVHRYTKEQKARLLDPMFVLLADTDPTVRAYTIQNMSYFTEFRDEIVPVLIEFREWDPDDYVRYSARSALVPFERSRGR